MFSVLEAYAVVEEEDWFALKDGDEAIGLLISKLLLSLKLLVTNSCVVVESDAMWGSTAAD